MSSAVRAAEARARATLSAEGVQQFVAGAWSEPEQTLEPEICDSSSGVPIFRQRASSEATIDRALALADRVAAAPRISLPDRVWLLRRTADQLERGLDGIAEAESLSTGVLLALTREMAGLLPRIFRGAAALLETDPELRLLPGPFGPVEIHRLPLGPAAVIAPWNAPAVIAGHKVASALAAGCPVVLKPSEWAPSPADRIARAIAAAEWPEGQFQLLHGDRRVGARLVSDPRIRAVSFTGGLGGGRAIAQACGHGMKAMQLELGGNNPFVVLESADLESALKGVLFTLTELNGQWCRGLGRILVHRSLAEPLWQGLVERLAVLRLGSSFDPESEMGPLVHHAHRELLRRTTAALAAQGAELAAPSRLPASGGYYFAPVVARGAPLEEEVFGPVASFSSFESADEGFRMAQASPYGLAAYVYGEPEVSLAFGRNLRAGVVKINGTGLYGLHPEAPRPAWGLSGLGDEGARDTLEFFRGSRVVGLAGRA